MPLYLCRLRAFQEPSACLHLLRAGGVQLSVVTCAPKQEYKPTTKSLSGACRECAGALHKGMRGSLRTEMPAEVYLKCSR